MRIIALWLAILVVGLDVHADEFDQTSISESEITCLALNVYHEARNQSAVGQVAAAFVPLNRVDSKRFPDTICGVVYQGYDPVRSDCHFSWYCDGRSDAPLESQAWDKAYTIAKWIAYNRTDIIDPTGGATHYHANYVTPWWSKSLTHLVDIDDHRFYYEDYIYATR